MDPRYQQPPRSAGFPASPRGTVNVAPQRPGPPGAANQMTRAEKFEDEKRRIMDSCFSKVDETGALLEQYITHIRVTEDSSYPQTPHPPTSPTANKERLILISVRNTGRVRVHKARENTNLTFSIGKTWNLDELSAVQSWSAFQPRTAQEEEWKGWARETGFTVTMGKPYFWMAGTSKEKEFFVASLVKIYRKYTGGQVPELIGFPQRDVEQMLGGGQVRSPSGGSPGPPPQIPAFSPGRPRGPSGDNVAPMGSPNPNAPLEPPPRNRPPTASSTQGSFFSQRAPSSSSTPPPSSSMYSQDPSLRGPKREPSRERMGMGMGPPPGGRGITPSASMSNLGPPRDRDRTPDSFGSRPNTAGRGADRRSPSRTRDEMGSRDSPRGQNGLGISGRPNGGPPPQGDMPPLPRPNPPFGYDSGRMRNGSQSSMDSQPDTALPERRRPPMATAQSNGSQTSMKSPMGQAGLRPAGGALSPAANASTDSLLKGRPPMPGGFIPSPAPNQEIERQGLLPAPLSPKPRIDPAIQSPPPQQAQAQPEPPAAKEEPKPEPSKPEPPKEEPKPEPVPTPAVEEKEKEAETPKEEEAIAARPGLGRMFGNNKKSAKEMFKSAATTYNAFVPRAGGAGARMRAAGAEPKEEEGITGVFQRKPLLDRTRTDDSVASAQSDGTAAASLSKMDTKDESSIQATPTSVLAKELPLSMSGGPEIPSTEPVPQVTVSSPLSPPKSAILPISAQNQPQETQPDLALEAAEKAAAALAAQKAKLAEEERKRKRRSATQMKYLSHLGVDAQILENKGLDFESVLDTLGWGGSAGMRVKNVAALELDVKREIARVEAGSWLGSSSSSSGEGRDRDERVDAVTALLDKTIAECDELDGLLTLYSVELSSLNDDIAFIEAQSQGLQVQTANQKLLQLELQNLVKTISIGQRELEPLRRPMPSNPQGLEAIERSLEMLYKAMVTIDPSIKQSSSSQGKSGAGGVGAVMGTSDLGNMVALQEKSDQYLSECSMFLKRFTQHMDLTFGAAFLSAQDVISRGKNSSSSLNLASAKLNTEPYDAARSQLWQYGPLMLFAKEVDRGSWDILMRMYQSRAKPVYTEEFVNNVSAWKKLTQKLSGDEAELLFTHAAAEKENEIQNMAATARRITVKRSQTLARGLRQTSSEKEKERAGKMAAGSLFPFDAFRGALEEMASLVSVEQNFVVEFFHATATSTLDFSDAIAAARPEDRRGDPYRRKAFEPDRELAKRVAGAMDDIFAAFDKEVSGMGKWALDASPLQGVGIMHALHKTNAQYEDTNQDFLNRVLTSQQQRLQGLWAKFVDEQVRAIESTKVRTDKRKGVVTFVKVFPDFAAAIENQLPSSAEEPALSSEVRALVDSAYTSLTAALFKTLRRMSKEMQTAGRDGATTLGAAREEIEEKNALNARILMIENLNHFVVEVEAHGDAVLEGAVTEAKEEYEDCLGVYVDSVVRRPLAKMMDFLDITNLALQSLPPTSTPSSLANRVQTSRTAFTKVLKDHASKKPKEKVVELTRRVEKHFGDGDEQNLSRELVGKVLARCEEKYNAVFERLQELGREVYDGTGVEGLESLGGREEVARWFRAAR